MADLAGTEGPDLSAYFDRIGYGGSTSPTLEVLAALQRLHTASIPFEAIDPFIGKPVDLSPEAIERKLIADRRGGYCFEQNAYFGRVLATLGFQVTRLIGRVLWLGEPDDPPRPRTHMALKLRLRGNDWLADVGFGGSTLTAPLLWMLETPQTTPHGVYRLRATGGDVVLQQELPGDEGDEWRPVYQLSPDPQLPIDYVPVNWYSSTHPDSRFRNNLICARSPEGRRINLLNNRLTLRPVGGEPERRVLDAEGIARSLVEDFGIAVRDEWRPALRRAVEIGNETA